MIVITFFKLNHDPGSMTDFVNSQFIDEIISFSVVKFVSELVQVLIAIILEIIDKLLQSHSSKPFIDRRECLID